MVRVFETPFHDPSAGLRLASFGVAEVGTTATAMLRVASGAHSLEDVLVGVLVGHSVGALGAAIHPPQKAPSDAPSAGVATAPLDRSFVFTWAGTF